jgi:GcrA cell cycle regulator
MTNEQIETIKQMWPNNSAREIAMVIGTTRNAVIGKARRLKLERKLKHKREPKQHNSIAMHITSKRLQKPSINRVVIDQFQYSGPVTIHDLKNRSCRFPLWSANESSGLYCGKCSATGQPYCEEHSRLCSRT